MAPVGKFMKALFLGLFSKSKWPRSSSSAAKNVKRRQVFDVGDLGSQLDNRSTADKVDDDILGVLGTVGTLTAVFFGQLPDGSQIAVKRLDTNRPKGVEEFAAEAKMLGNIHHKNLSSLCGFCANGKERLIVYHYMVNLSLYTHLHGSLSSTLVLDWPRRMSIAIGAAEGLAHLHHHEVSQRFVHGDIKSSNVLLDENFEAKWADFGLMRLMQEGRFSSGGIRGVVDYFPPEYHKECGPTQRGDVFGFGILLLELISGKKPLEKFGSMAKQKSMWGWAEQLIAEGRYSELVDPRLEGKYTRDALNLAVYVSTMCAHSTPNSRLTMIEAADLLKCGNICCSSDESYYIYS